MDLTIAAFIMIAALLSVYRKTAFSVVVLVQLIISAGYVEIYNANNEHGSWIYFFTLYMFNFIAAVGTVFVKHNKPAYLLFVVPMVYNILVAIEWLNHGYLILIDSQHFHAEFTHLEWLLTDRYTTIMTILIILQLIASGVIKRNDTHNRYISDRRVSRVSRKPSTAITFRETAK